MSLLAAARLDTQRILGDKDSGFSEEVTIFDAVGGSQTLNAFNVRITQEIDPETGLMIVSKKSVINVYLADITLGEPQKNWRVDFKDYSGSTISGRVKRVEPDKTFGFVSLFLGV